MSAIYYELEIAANGISEQMLSELVELHQSYISHFTGNSLTELKKWATQNNFTSSVFCYNSQSGNLLNEIDETSHWRYNLTFQYNLCVSIDEHDPYMKLYMESIKDCMEFMDPPPITSETVRFSTQFNIDFILAQYRKETVTANYVVLKTELNGSSFDRMKLECELDELRDKARDTAHRAYMTALKGLIRVIDTNFSVIDKRKTVDCNVLNWDL